MARDPAIDDVAGRSVVHSVFSILRELRNETVPVGVSALARRTGLPKSTVQRLLAQMAAEGAVQRVDRAWTLGRPPARAAGDPRSLSGLRNVARPRLRRIAMATGASTFLLVGDNGGPVALDQVSGTLIDPALSPERQVRASARPGPAAAAAMAPGGPAVDQGGVHPDYECLATVFPLASGDAALLSVALPRGRGVERLARALDRVAEIISDEVRRLAADGW